MADLTAKQKAFIREYPIDSNGKQAAIRAGYAPKNAEITASKLLTLSKVSSLIDKAIEKLDKEAGLTALEAKLEVKALAQSNVLDGMQMNRNGEFVFKDIDAIPPEFFKAVSEVTTYQLPDGGGLAMKLKMHPKLPALKMEYDRHSLIAPEGGTVNNIAEMHVNILELNAAKRRAGLPEIEG
jgi:phage terminase small subunit